MKTIKDIDISGKRVFIRVDFNVPLDVHQNITDDSRIRAVLPTLDISWIIIPSLSSLHTSGDPTGKSHLN